MTKSKLEKVLEYMVNGERELASEMLHEHIIESAREIYADLAEEDEMVEEELELDEDEDLDEAADELDEDEDLDEGYHTDDKSGDFEDDISTMEDEVEAEEHFGEAEDEDEEAMDDLEGEMDMDMDDEMGDMEMDGEAGDAETAMQNVEDAMDELKAVFADLMGDDVEDEMDDEVADEFGGDDMDMDVEDDMEESFMEDEDLEEADLEEGATLHKHGNVTMAGDEDGKASPIPQNAADMSQGHAKRVDFAGGAAEGDKGTGGKAKNMSVTGPQEQKGKMDKKVAAPSNSSEKATSLLNKKKVT